MSKTLKVTLIVATCCVALGIILATSAVAAVGFDVRRLSNASLRTQHEYVSEQKNIQKITVEGLSENYSIVQGSSETVEVSYFEDDQTSFTFKEQGDTLSIQENHQFTFMLFNFDFSAFDQQAEIRLPVGFTGIVEVYSASGRVVAQDLSTLETLQLKTSSGSIRCATVSAQTIELDSSSGSISCENSKADTLSLKSTSGSVSSKKNTEAGKLSLESSSGSISCENSSADNVSLESISGSVSCENSNATTLSLKSTSGSIKTDKIIVSSKIAAYSTSGSIRINLQGSETDYDIWTKSVSGIIDVPRGNTTASTTVELETISGSISLDFMG